MLYADTTIRRVVFDQMIQKFVAADLNAPTNSERLVQIVVPEGTTLFVGHDVDPKAVGLNQAEYKLPPMSPGQTIEFALRPHQYLVGASAGKLITCALIIQHMSAN